MERERERKKCANLPHIASIAPETAALIKWLLDTSRVDQVEGRLIFVVIVGVLAAGSKLRRVLVWNYKRYSALVADGHHNLTNISHTN